MLRLLTERDAINKREANQRLSVHQLLMMVVIQDKNCDFHFQTRSSSRLHL